MARLKSMQMLSLISGRGAMRVEKLTIYDSLRIVAIAYPIAAKPTECSSRLPGDRASNLQHGYILGDTENSCQDLALPGPSTNAVIPALNASPSSPGLSTSPAIPGFSTDPVTQGRSTSQAIAGPSKQAITSPIGGHATSINILTPHNSRYYPRPVHEISLSVERERKKREKNCNSH